MAFCRGLATARLHGRAQVVHDVVSDPQDSSGSMKTPCGDLIFYLDGAHSPESMEACGQWFSTAVRGNKSLSTAVNGYRRHRETGRDFNRVSKQVLKTNSDKCNFFVNNSFAFLSMQGIAIEFCVPYFETTSEEFFLICLIDSSIQLHGSERPSSFTSKARHHLRFLG